MLSTAAIQKLAKIAKIKEADLTAAIKDAEEKDITVPENLTVLDETELDTLKKNEYKNGKEKGLEMTVKETKDKLGLEFNGKTLDGLIDAYKAKVLANVKQAPDEKVTELENKLKTVQATATELESKLATKDGEIASIRTGAELHKYVPEIANENGPSFDRDDIITMMKSKGYDFKIGESGGLIAMKDGQPVIDKISNPVPVKDVVTGFLKEKKLIGEEQDPPGGRGAGSSAGSFKPGKLSELKAKYEKEGKSTLGADFMNEASALAKENADFMTEGQ